MGESAPGQQTSSRPPDQFDSVLAVLAAEHCREVLAYFQQSDSESASTREVADWIAERREGASAADLEIRAHHVTLPKLKDCGLIDYDPRQATVRYDAPAAVSEFSSVLSDSSLAE